MRKLRLILKPLCAFYCNIDCFVKHAEVKIFVLNQIVVCVCVPICKAQNILDKQQYKWRLLVQKCFLKCTLVCCYKKQKKEHEKSKAHYETFVCILLQYGLFVERSEVKSFVLYQNVVCVSPTVENRIFQINNSINGDSQFKSVSLIVHYSMLLQ